MYFKHGLSYFIQPTKSSLMKIFKITILLTLLTIVACADKTWQAEYDTVMEIHDEVMPEIGTITKTKKAIKKHLESLGETQPETREKALNLMRDLDKAEEGMWDWMNAFKKPSGSTEHAEAVKYLQAEKVKISQVSKDMKSSIKAGKAFLESVQ